MYCQLGDIIFEGLVGFQTLSHASEENYAEHQLIDGKPRLQKLGSKLDTIDGSIRFMANFCDPEQEIQKLKEARTSGRVMPFIMGDGRFVGDFLIISMSNDIEQISVGGSLQSAKLSIQLKEYYTPDKEANDQQQAAADGFANQQNTPPISQPTNVPNTDAMQAGDAFSSGNANIMATSDLASTLSDTSTLLKTQVQTMQGKVGKALSDVNKMVALITADPTSELYTKTVNLQNSAADLITKLTDLAGDIGQLLSDIDTNPGDVPASIIIVGNSMQDVLDQVAQCNADANQMAAMIALKK